MDDYIPTTLCPPGQCGYCDVIRLRNTPDCY